MSEAVLSLPRGREGWRAQETEALWDEVRACAAEGKPLRAAFEQTARRTGRKTNSIRNHYYASLRQEGAPPDLTARRGTPFCPFTQEEVDALLEAVLTAKAAGKSVRACVLALAGGDKSGALRLQNKYRSILKNQPQRLQRIAETLQKRGLACPAPLEKPKAAALSQALRQADGETARAILRAFADALEKYGLA